MSELGQQLIAIVRRKAAESPGFVYQREAPDDEGYRPGLSICKYVHSDGGPGCLIGQALFDAGLIDVDFNKSERNSSTICNLAEYYQWDIDPTEIGWLREVQRNQDRDTYWGDAVAAADDILRAVPSR
jgi:hypothetical protein